MGTDTRQAKKGRCLSRIRRNQTAVYHQFSKVLHTIADLKSKFVEIIDTNKQSLA